MRTTFLTLAMMISAQVAPLAAQTGAAAHRFEIGDSDFLLDGKRLQIRCGEMHFARLPKEYWQHRLKMMKAMGFNAVCAYVFWNYHEEKPGQYNFSGDRDAAEFCRMAQKEGLWVVLRPGPYVCAEWEFGGFPWWLLKEPSIRVRTQDPKYLERCGMFLKALGKELAPLEAARGGPILMVQVENEYGSYGHDREYLGKVRDMLVAGGFRGPFFTCDGPSQLKNDVRPDIFSVVNFGYDPDGAFRALRAVRPKGPLMCGEYYPGWFDSWGEKHHTGPADKMVRELGQMLDANASFSMYMAHGGTTFGLWSGANSPPYKPETSSYDYDAPLSEAGWDTPKFHAIRELFAKHLLPGETLPDVPPRNPVIAIPGFAVGDVAPVFANLPLAKSDATPKNMEAYDQGYGCILYRTKLAAGPAGTVELAEIHDWAPVFLDGKRIDLLDRRHDKARFALPERKTGATLDILVEAMGRVNYGPHLHDRKGIIGPVKLVTASGAREMKDWLIYNLPLDHVELAALRYAKAGDAVGGPAFHRGAFTLGETGDTFLDMRSWGKGVAWVNGHCLGRFWRIGPTQTMYVPGPWLRKGSNEIIILDLEGPEKPECAGLREPILDELREDASARAHRKPGQNVALDGISPAAAGVWENTNKWQDVKFTAPAAGRYLCIQSLSAYDGSPFASLAEVEGVDAKGAQIPRGGWKVAYADSEELASENGSADNLFDLQPTTFWHTQWSKAKPGHPHLVVIDLGGTFALTGLRVLPRPDISQGATPGRIKDYKIYLSEQPFPGQ